MAGRAPARRGGCARARDARLFHARARAGAVLSILRRRRRRSGRIETVTPRRRQVYARASQYTLKYYRNNHIIIII